MDLLKEIHDMVTVHTVLLKGIKSEQEKTNGRLTKVEADGFMMRGGLAVLGFIMIMSVAVVGIIVVAVI